MASSLGRLLKATMEVSVKGADTAKSKLRDLRGEIDRLGSTSASAGSFATQAKQVAQVGDAAKTTAAAFSLSRAEALALNYTINDITASLASGTSPFTILLQQGGQVQQVFGSASNLLGKLAAQFVRFAPQIAAVGAAVAAVSFVKLGRSAAEAAEEIGALTDKANVSLETFQQFEAAGAAKGLNGDTIAQALNSIGNAALKSAEGATDFAQRWGAARQTGSQIVSDSKLIAEGLERSGATAKTTGDIFVDLGIDLRRYSGSVEDQTKLLYDLADAVAAISNSGGRRSAQILRDFRSQFGSEALRVFKLGAAGIREFGAEAGVLGPKLLQGQVDLGKKYQEQVRLFELGSKRLKESVGAVFIPAAIAGQDLFTDLLIKRSEKAAEFRGALETTARAIEDFFRVISGKQSTFSSPFLAGVVEGVRFVRDAVSAAADAIPDLFEQIKQSAENGLTALDSALSNAGGGISEVYQKIKDSSKGGVDALKAAFAGFKIDAGVVGVILGVVGAIKTFQLTAQLAAPVILAFGVAIGRLAVGTALAPLRLVSNAIQAVGSAAGAAIGFVASFAVRIAELAIGGVAGTLRLVAGATAAVGSAAAAATGGVLSLAKALAALTIGTVFSPAVLGVGAILAAVSATVILLTYWDKVPLAIELAGAAINAKFLAPMEEVGLKTAAVFLTIFGLLKSVGDVLNRAIFGPVVAGFEFLYNATIKGFSQYINAIIGIVKIIAPQVGSALEAAWKGAGSNFDAFLKGIKNSQNEYIKSFASNFDPASAAWNKGVSLEQGTKAAQENLSRLEKAWSDSWQGAGNLRDDFYSRFDQLIGGTAAKLKDATGVSIDPQNLGGSLLQELERLYIGVETKVKGAASGAREAGTAAEEAASKVQKIGIIKGGIRSEVPVLTKQVNDLGAAADGVSRKTVSINVGKGGAISSATVNVEQVGQAADRSTDKVSRLRDSLGGIDRVEVPQSYLVDTIEKPLGRAADSAQRFIDKQKEAANARPAAPVDTASIDQANTKLRETERLQQTVKANTVAPVVAPTAADPQNPQTSPLEASRAAVATLGQLIQSTLQQAQTFAAASVLLVANGVTQLTDPAIQSINSLNNALTNAIQSVNQLASSLASLPALKDYSGSNSGGSSGTSSGFAGGGFVLGPGTSTSDSIPAWLSTGEFVVRAAAVQKYGLDLFRRLNGMTVNTPKTFAPRFAMGGLVSPSSLSSAQSSVRPLVLQIDGKSFGGLSGPPGVVNALEKHVTQRRLSSTVKTAPSWVR